MRTEEPNLGIDVVGPQQQVLSNSTGAAEKPITLDYERRLTDDFGESDLDLLYGRHRPH